MRKTEETKGEKVKKGPKLRAETRAYTLSEEELCEWLTGSGNPRFYIKEVWIQPTGSIEFTVTTEKQAEVPVVRRAGAPNDLRESARPEPWPPFEQGKEPQTGPALEGDGEDEHGREAAGVVGTADPVPAIATRGEVQRKQVKSMRQLQLEARAQGKPEPRSVAHITERPDDADDPVPSAIPR